MRTGKKLVAIFRFPYIGLAVHAEFEVIYVIAAPRRKINKLSLIPPRVVIHRRFYVERKAGAVSAVFEIFAVKTGKCVFGIEQVVAD